MPDYLVWAYPIVATKTLQPISTADPTAAINIFVERVDWESLFDPICLAEEVEYMVGTRDFEAFEVRRVGAENARVGTIAVTGRPCFLSPLLAASPRRYPNS